MRAIQATEVNAVHGGTSLFAMVEGLKIDPSDYPICPMAPLPIVRNWRTKLGTYPY